MSPDLSSLFGPSTSESHHSWPYSRIMKMPFSKAVLGAQHGPTIILVEVGEIDIEPLAHEPEFDRVRDAPDQAEAGRCWCCSRRYTPSPSRAGIRRRRRAGSASGIFEAEAGRIRVFLGPAHAQDAAEIFVPERLDVLLRKDSSRSGSRAA